MWAWKTLAWVWGAQWFSGKLFLSFAFHHLHLGFSICIPGTIITAHWAFCRHVGRISKWLWTSLSSLKERCDKKFKAGAFHARHWIHLHLNLCFIEAFFCLKHRAQLISRISIKNIIFMDSKECLENYDQYGSNIIGWCEGECSGWVFNKFRVQSNAVTNQLCQTWQKVFLSQLPHL